MPEKPLPVRDLVKKVQKARADLLRLTRPIYRETWDDPNLVDKWKRAGEELDELEAELALRAEGPPNLFIRKKYAANTPEHAPHVISARRLGTFHWDSVGLKREDIWNVSQLRRGDYLPQDHQFCPMSTMQSELSGCATVAHMHIWTMNS